jgi:hypothetical protein
MKPTPYCTAHTYSSTDPMLPVQGDWLGSSPVARTIGSKLETGHADHRDT